MPKTPKPLRPRIGYGVVLKGTGRLCFGNDFTKQPLWQVYKSRRAAMAWTVPGLFGDGVEYEVVKVSIQAAERKDI